MITFLTLFLSLVAGPQTIEVAGGLEVVQIELFLDGSSLGARSASPWRWAHDFGRELAPRELLAIARDAQGQEIGRARQLLNIPQPRTGAALSLESSGDRRWARLVWQTVERQEPESLTLELDGRPVAFTDPERIELPPADPETLHLVTATVSFPDGTEARAWTTFGGSFADRSEARLTAFPVRVATAGTSLSPLDLAGGVKADGETLRVLAVEEGPVEILLVRAPDTREALSRLGMGENARSNDEPVVDPLRNMPLFLQQKDRFNVLATWCDDPSADRTEAAAETAAEAVEPSLFPLLISDRRVLRTGLPTILTRGFVPVPEGARHRLADAVAAAGRAVAANRRPRAVVLVVGGKTKDYSVYSPAQVRRYLSMLRVPLAVWHIPTRRGQKAPLAWGETADISTPIRLREALSKLRDDLNRQRIVWVAGSHLPQRIRLDSPPAIGADLVD